MTSNSLSSTTEVERTSPRDQRAQFILGLRANATTDKRVLSAMETIDRRHFIGDVFVDLAYDDQALPIACGQTISQPSVVALMTQALAVEPRHKVLEIGTGSGYQAAILSQLARRVYTIERHGELVKTAQSVFDKLRLSNITVIAGDGTLGAEAQAPFDRIILTAAAEDPPARLLEQLRVGGIMIVPVGRSDTIQQLIRVHKTETGLEYEELIDVRFVPLLEGIASAG